MSESERKRDGPGGFGGREVSLELLRRAGVITLPWEVVSAHDQVRSVPKESLFVWDVLLGASTAPAAPALAAAAATPPSATEELLWHWPSNEPDYEVSLALPKGLEADGTLLFKFSFHNLRGPKQGQAALALVGKSVTFAGHEQTVKELRLGSCSGAVAEFLVSEKPEGEETLKLAIDGIRCSPAW